MRDLDRALPDLLLRAGRLRFPVESVTNVLCLAIVVVGCLRVAIAIRELGKEIHGDV